MKELTELNAKIQICPICGKIDVYKNDGHICSTELQEQIYYEDMKNEEDILPHSY